MSSVRNDLLCVDDNGDCDGGEDNANSCSTLRGVLCAKSYAGHFPFSGPGNLMKSQPDAGSTIFPLL